MRVLAARENGSIDGLQKEVGVRLKLLKLGECNIFWVGGVCGAIGDSAPSNVLAVSALSGASNCAPVSVLALSGGASCLNRFPGNVAVMAKG